jgi:AAA+ ATPase superfamily predicted ATPase
VFVGRQRELALLEEAHAARRSALIPIYGRRRVGKSELILKFLRGKPGLYFLGKAAPAALQIREFLREAARSLQEPLLASLSVESWSDALAAVIGRWRGPGKLPLVLDEFQWIAGASPELPSVLQELWDRSWSRTGRVMLILCGSYVGFMEREVLGKKSPLFGRRTAQIQLSPFSYREAALFHPGWSLVERAKAYFICGGIPLYLQQFHKGQSVEKNIEAQLLDEFAPLYREPEFLLREELRDVENYHAVLMAIAAECSTNQAIAKKTGLPERSLH